MFGKGITIVLRKPQPGRRNQRKGGHRGERHRLQVGTGCPAGGVAGTRELTCEDKVGFQYRSKARGHGGAAAPAGQDSPLEDSPVLSLAGSSGPSCKGRDLGLKRIWPQGHHAWHWEDVAGVLVRLGVTPHGGRGLPAQPQAVSPLWARLFPKS